MKTGSRFNYNGYQLEITLIEYNDIAQDFEVCAVCVGGSLRGTKKVFSGNEFIQAEKTGEIEEIQCVVIDDSDNDIKTVIV